MRVDQNERSWSRTLWRHFREIKKGCDFAHYREFVISEFLLRGCELETPQVVSYTGGGVAVLAGLSCDWCFGIIVCFRVRVSSRRLLHREVVRTHPTSPPGETTAVGNAL
jgi:hypothetical protein